LRISWEERKTKDDFKKVKVSGEKDPMKIIYLYRRNAYAAIMAAYAHLKLNAPKNLDYVRESYRKEGYFFYLGMDEDFNEVYLLYSERKGLILTNLLHGFAALYHQNIKIIDLN